MGEDGNANWSEMPSGPQQTITDLFLAVFTELCCSAQDFLQSAEHNWTKLSHLGTDAASVSEENIDLGSVLKCSTLWDVKFILFASKIL